MVVLRYGITLLVCNSTTHSFAALTRELFHIVRPCWETKLIKLACITGKRKWSVSTDQGSKYSNWTLDQPRYISLDLITFVFILYYTHECSWSM